MAERGMEDPLILHRILSFLTAKEAAKTSLFSKAWLEAWRTRPTLEFDDQDLFCTMKSAANLSDRALVRERKRIVRKFSRYITTTMRRYSDRKLRINTLKFNLVRGVMSKSVIGESIRLAIENNVRTLDLCLYVSGNVMELSEDVFGGKSIVNLKLTVCNLKTLSIDQIRCHNIQKLDFDRVYLDELMFENIIHSCPLLQLLKIGRVERVREGDGYPHSDDTDGAPVFRLKKHANLQKIDFELLKFQSLLFGELPRLESLVCSNYESYLDTYYESYLDTFPEDLVDSMPCFFPFQSPRYQNMTTLVLCAVGIGNDFFNNFAYMFPNVEDLSIKCCHNLRILKLSSPSIKRIGLGGNQQLKEAHFDLPRIVYLEVWSLLRYVPVVSFTAVSGGWVSSLSLDCGYGLEGPSLWFRKLKDLLSGLYQSEIFLSIAFPGIPEFNLDEIRNICVSSKPVMVQELSVSFHEEELMSSTVSILDSIFCVCRPRIIKQHWAEILCMKPLYKILVLKRNQDRIRFWQIDLKDVQVGTFKSDVSPGFGNKIEQRGACICFHSRTVFELLEMGGSVFHELLEMGDNVLDWKGFFVLSRSIAGAEGIYIKFEWRGLQNEGVNSSPQIGVALQNY